MKERARMLYGTFEIRSEPMKGSQIAVNIPLKKAHTATAWQEPHIECRDSIVVDQGSCCPFERRASVCSDNMQIFTASARSGHLLSVRIEYSSAGIHGFSRVALKGSGRSYQVGGGLSSFAF
jgi:hypothetical protein